MIPYPMARTGLRGMASQNEEYTCAFCRRGRAIKRKQEVAFRQRTDKGYVFCRVTIHVGICTECGAKSVDHSAEAIMDEAVRREYDKMS